MTLRSIALIASLTFWSITLLAGDVHHHDASEKLGTVNFPTSCAPGVQPSFERGVALLYSFEYDESEKQFKEVSAQDLHCAMAYWGQAMSLYHQLWNRPGKSD